MHDVWIIKAVSRGGTGISSPHNTTDTTHNTTTTLTPTPHQHQTSTSTK